MSTKEQIHKNHRNRMKNIFIEHGFSAFSEIQKLEFILFFAIPQKDVNPLAHKLLAEYGSLSKVLSASYEDLVKIDGIGSHTALLLKTFKAVNKESPVVFDTTKLGSTSASKQYCYSLLRNAEVEEFYVICLDDCNKIIKTKKINTGSANKVHIEISDITRLIFNYNASKIILSHNHPNGVVDYSDDDIHITNSIMCSCLLNSVEVVDHIVVTATDAFSFAEAGLIESIRNNCLSNLNIKRPTVDPASPFEEYQISTHITINKSIN